MRWDRRENLILGPNTIEMLLPHRRPFLMVDSVRSFTRESVPSIQTGRHISSNETCFSGHFPGLYVWPGVFTIEGLGQSGVILITLLELCRTAEAEGSDPEAVLEMLRNVDRSFRLQADTDRGAGAALQERLEQLGSRIAVGTSVEMKFMKPVFAGQRLDYRVEITGQHGAGLRIQGEASVDGETVGRGVLMGAAVARPRISGR